VSALDATAGVTSAQAKRLALVAPLAAAVLAFVADTTGARDVDMSKVLAGMTVLMILLSLLAEGAPGLAAGFAWLVLITAMFVLGGPAWESIARLTK